MSNILITTECVADLPEELLAKYGIEVIYYDVETEKGIFRDTAEVDSQNLVEYMSDGIKKAHSRVPDAKDYTNYFMHRLKCHDEIIHITISDKISKSHQNASMAKSMMGTDGERVHILDSQNLSSGQGLLVLEAGRLAEEKKSSKEILETLQNLIPRISTSFITYNADYLYYNGKVSRRVKEFCNTLKLHPVLYTNEEGKLTVKTVYIGNYEKAWERYVKQLLKKQGPDKEHPVFITYVGCTHQRLSKVEETVKKYIGDRTIYEVQASATVSCNSGPNTFGVLFVREK